MQKIWNVAKTNVTLQKRLSAELNIPALIAQLLINRGVVDFNQAERFLSCKLSGLYNPFLLKGMDKAVARIKDALQKKQKIVIWGDYDVDGLTAAALLESVLRSLGADITHYIPNRAEEGYGLNSQGIKKVSKDRANLVITVDCGINSDREVNLLNAAGIDVIITDHHQPLGKNAPPALSVINPLQEGCNYPFKYLAGVGLAFKLSQALTGSDLFEHLDLVALGTVSDVAPVTDENRILIKHGLAQLSRTQKKGLNALMERAGLKDKELTSMHAGFIIGPRLNATGRVGSAESSLGLLLADSSIEAGQLAEQLNEDNRFRQQIEAKTLKEALLKIEKEVNFKQHRVIVLYKDDWHTGVIGIVASRVAERFYRPAILLSAGIEDNTAKGSGRSIKDFHLFEALENCKYYLNRFGGHSKACGLSLPQGRIEDFKDAINDYSIKMVLPEVFTPKIGIDAEIPLCLLNEGLLEQLNILAPFGPENPKPVFMTRAATVKASPRVAGKNTLKMWVSDGGLTCEAVGFKMAETIAVNDVPGLIDIVYTAGINEWQGNRTIELHLKDLRATQPL